MKAILIDKDTNALSWSDVPNPVVGPEDALVEIHAAALNRADLMQRAGDYPPPPGCPEWMGLEIAGVIVELGEEAKKKSSWKIGDKVCALLGGGGYAEYANVKYDMLMPVPETCTFEEAAAIPEAFATAYLNLFIEGGLKAGDTLLMHAGASGLASVVIPMAKAFGARVITTVIEDSVIDRIKHLGADRVVNSRKEDIVKVLEEERDAGHPIDVAIDCLGGSIQGKCLQYMRYGGRWIMIATLAGDITEVDLKKLYVLNVRLIGSTLRSKKPEFKAKLLATLVKDVWPKIDTGEVRPTIYKVLPITEAEAAHAILERGENVGKVVLKVREGRENGGNFRVRKFPPYPFQRTLKKRDKSDFIVGATIVARRVSGFPVGEGLIRPRMAAHLRLPPWGKAWIARRGCGGSKPPPYGVYASPTPPLNFFQKNSKTP